MNWTRNLRCSNHLQQPLSRIVMTSCTPNNKYVICSTLNSTSSSTRVRLHGISHQPTTLRRVTCSSNTANVHPPTALCCCCCLEQIAARHTDSLGLNKWLAVRWLTRDWRYFNVLFQLTENIKNSEPANCNMYLAENWLQYPRCHSQTSTSFQVSTVQRSKLMLSAKNDRQWTARSPWRHSTTERRNTLDYWMLTINDFSLTHHFRVCLLRPHHSQSLILPLKQTKTVKYIIHFSLFKC